MLSEKEIKYYEDQGYDLEFISRIQPQGGLTAKERYIKRGDGYTETLRLYALPKDVPPFWQTKLVGNLNTVTLTDVGTANREQVLSSVNKALSEFGDNMVNERKSTHRQNAADEYTEAVQFSRSIMQGGEVVKLALIRIYVNEPTFEGMEKTVAEIKKKLFAQEYKLTAFLFEPGEEFDALFTSYSEQQENSTFLNNSEGMMIPATAMGGGYPFNHVYLRDPFGTYLGTTDTGGEFIYDAFRVTEDRTSFSGIMFGLPGYGKSTLMKMLEEGLVGRNTMVRGIEKNRDWYKLIDSQDGLVVDLSGQNGLINPLEITATKTDVYGLKIDEIGSYLQHKTKFLSQIQFLNPEIRAVDKLLIGNILDNFYVYKGLLPGIDYTARKEEIQVTGRPVTDYPIISELLDYLDRLYATDFFQLAPAKKQETLEDFRTVINAMATDYSALFNGHTTFPDYQSQQVLFFDIDGISSLPKELFNCQLFTALSLTWSQAMKNGRLQKQLLESGEITIEDVVYFIFLMDECQNIINLNNIFAVEYVVNFLKEMRKFAAGIYLATQSPQELLPEGASSEDISKIKQVFELCPAKFLLHLDDSVIGRMREVLGGSLTSSEFASLSKLKKGQVFVSLGGVDSYTVNVNPTEEQLERFAGGL